MTYNAYQRRAYQFGAYQMEPVTAATQVQQPTVLTNKPAGPAFTRKRYRDLVELERQARAAERKALELQKQQEREAVIAAAQEAQRLAREARERDSSAWHDDFALLRLRHALESFNGAHTALAALHAAKMIELSAHAARAQFDDDDDAISLLLLH